MTVVKIDDPEAAIPRQAKAAFPPGPKSWFPGAAYLALHRDPLGSLIRMARDYGDIVHMQIGGRHDYLLNHPDYIGQVLQAQQGMARSTPRSLKQLFGKGLLTSQGDFHHRQRRLIQPAFHGKRLEAYGGIMTEFAARLSDHWQDGAEVDLAEAMLHLTLGIVVKTLFGCDIETEAKNIGSLMASAVRSTHKSSLPYLDTLLRKLPLPGEVRLRKASAQLDALIMRMIRERREEKGREREDLLSSLLQMEDAEGASSDEQVRDEVMTLFLAGHETVASALTWTWYLLSQNPAVEKALLAELDAVLGGRLPTPEDLKRLTYTDMVFSESLRMFPPVWLMVRKPLQDCSIGGYTIRAGSYLHISQYVTHRDARFFPDPERFDPMRWTPEAVAARPKYSYFPFGGGPRRCIGDGFAWTEVMLVIATLAQKWRMSLVPGRPVELDPLITLRPKHGMKMKLQRRG